MKKFIIAFFLLLLLFLGSFFYFNYQVSHSLGKNQNQEIEIVKGQGAKEIGLMLEKKGVISNDVYFKYYILKNDIADKILPGNYWMSSGMTIPEIVQLFISKKTQDIKITFPEGWTLKQMAERLSEKGLPGEEFLNLSQSGEQFSSQYNFLKNRKVSSLEGYLFPDTYFFLPESSAEKIIKKMLDNFQQKVDVEIQKKIETQGKSLDEIVTMASIIEKEVSEDEDRKIVSGIFWSRIEVGQALQSCATIAYVLGENKKQYSYQETRIESPFNTYVNPGLPPGPIDNPSLSAILAAISPKDSLFVYFLNDPKTGKTIFSKTLEEHNFNKNKYGL